MQFKKKYAALCVSTLLALPTAVTHAANSYSIVELGTIETSFSSNGYSLNNAGQVSGIGYDVLNLPIRTDVLDLDDPLLSVIEDFDNLSPNEYLYLRNYLNRPSGPLNQPTFQKLRIADGFIYDDGFFSLSEAFDVVEPVTGTLSFSNSVYPVDINNNGHVVGDTIGPFLQASGTNSEGEATEYFSPEHLLAGFWSDGQNIRVLQSNEDVVFGGTSKARSMNDNGLVVGFAAVSNREVIENSFRGCTNEEIENEDGETVPNADIPLGACLYRVWAAAEYNASLRLPLYNEEAYVWELDSAGNVLSQRALGVAFEPPESASEESYVRSEAIDVNNNGDIVGFTNFGDGNLFFNFATIFTEAGAQQILGGEVEGATQSQARAVNDEGVIVGFALRRTSTSVRNRLFIADVTDANRTENADFPRGFFEDSAWTPNDINNLNQVVGNAEREETQVTERRKVGFIYDIATDQITDLNDLIPCDSGYRIIDAVDINDNGEILVNALTTNETEVNGRTFSGSSQQMLLLTPSEENVACDKVGVG